MRKFLVFFVLLFGVVCGAMAEDGIWPQNFQNTDITGSCHQKWESSGSAELVVYFDTDVHTTPKCKLDLSSWVGLLERNKDDIDSILIHGSADRDRHDGKLDNNAILSKQRAEWMIDHALPESWKQYCGFEAKQPKECRVYAMGDSNDFATSDDDGARNSNDSARSAHMYVIWKREVCQQQTMNNINDINTKLAAIKSKHTDKTEQINKALNIIEQLNKICTEAGVSLYASGSEEYSKLLSELGTILTDLAKTIPDISMLFQQSDFSAMFSTADIDLYYSRIQGLMGNRSVWRNTEGRFNTARLASDSIAGVVLGTIGGIVTSKLVKKNQLKQGFEDLSCNVGGQRVADYGDTFSIGLQ